MAGKTIASIETNVEILKLRLQGYSIRTTAAMVGGCYQTIANYLKTFDKSGKYGYSDISPYHKLDESKFDDMATAIVCCHGKAENIAAAMNMPLEDVYLVLDYVVTKKPMPCRKCIYPNVSAWMRLHCVSLTEFGDKLGMTAIKLRAVLSGTTHLPLAVAEKISKFTGLSISQIYEAQVNELTKDDIAVAEAVSSVKKKKRKKTKTVKKEKKTAAKEETVPAAKPAVSDATAEEAPDSSESGFDDGSDVEKDIEVEEKTHMEFSGVREDTADFREEAKEQRSIAALIADSHNTTTAHVVPPKKKKVGEKK